MENEKKVNEAETMENATEQNTAAPIVPEQIEEKKGFLGWVKEHKKAILGGLAAVGGGIVCFVLGAATQRSSDSVEDDSDLYDSDGNYEPTVYQFEPETDSNDEDEAV